MLLSTIFTLIGIAAVLFLLRFLVALEADGRSARKRPATHRERFYTYRLPLVDAESRLHKRNADFIGA